MNADLPTSFGEVLQQLRKQKKLGQQMLAERLGVHRNTIGAWERGDRLPETRGMVLELARQLHLSEEQTHMLLQASLTGLSSYWQVPYPRNPFFSGRSHLLAHLHQQLASNQTVALSQSYGITGLGGIGKTQLALEYAYQHAQGYHAVFWIGSETIDTIYSHFTLIAEQLQLLEGEKQDQQQLVKAVQRWLATHKDWLLIFDNVEDLAVLKAFLPPARAGAVLVTTRLHALAGLAHTLELGAFAPEEALHFLLARAHLVDPKQSLDDVPLDVLEAAQTLVTAVDGLPLALDQAGAYLEQTGCTLADYLRLFERHTMRLLSERLAVADHPASVLQTFLLSFEKVEQSRPAAGDLLRLCALLHPDAIPEELIREGASQWSAQLGEAVSDPFAFEQTMAELLRFSLVKRSSEQRALSMHRLVQAVLLGTMTEAERDQWFTRVLTTLDLVFPKGGEHEDWGQCERLLPHALLCVQQAKTSQKDLILSSLTFKAAQYLRERGRYSEAEPLFQRALAICEQQLGPEHAEVASSLHGLANLYFDQGKYEEAESLFQRALAIRERQMDPTYFDVVSTLNRLAALYADQGKYSEAEPLFQRALTICEQQLGSEHAEVVKLLGNLATLYVQQGKYAQAEPLYLRALHIREQMLGEMHPLVALPLNGLATLYMDQGKYSEAEPLYKRALSIAEHHLGAEHTRVAILLNNLAELYRLQGNYTEAEPLYERALSLVEHLLGSEHPLAAYPLTGLANVYRELGQYAEAEALYLRALHIREHLLEPHHLDTAGTLHELASLREAQGDPEGAASLYRRALTIREQVLGSQHPGTIETYERLHLVLITLGKAEEEAPVEQTETRGML
jgi:tetratricopeptide (TPR) repeat protein/transcriptional regulator with XRE-family HTH domain